MNLAAFFRRKPWKRATAWLCFLGPFFFLTYGLATAHTASLPHVGSVVLGLDKSLPFIPWMIVPYWSIDFFYGLSLFLWASRRSLDRHALRLVAATVVCVSGFLLFPLKFSFARPEIAQPFFRLLFDLLETFDQPYNQAPSLHLCLLIILWDAYARHVSSKRRWIVHLWAGLIGVSIFTTWQHHIIDGIAAVPVAFLICYCIPVNAPAKAPGRWISAQPARARRLGGKYTLTACLLAAVAFAGFALTAGGLWFLFLWPAFCVGAVATGYLGLGPRVFQKTPGMGADAGTRPFASRVLLAPYEYGARLYRRKYLARLPAAAEVAPGLWLGAFPEALPAPGCGVLDLTSEYVRPVSGTGPYASVPLLDLLPPNARELEDALACLAVLREQGPVLVHCALGMTRSALVAVCAMVLHGHCGNVREAFRRIEAVRPIMVSEAALAVAEAYTAGRRSV